MERSNPLFFWKNDFLDIWASVILGVPGELSLATRQNIQFKNIAGTPAWKTGVSRLVSQKCRVVACMPQELHVQQFKQKSAVHSLTPGVMHHPDVISMIDPSPPQISAIPPKQSVPDSNLDRVTV